jgi:phosphoribosylcarboxyaminoimidazole (NCAIR) mutase
MGATNAGHLAVAIMALSSAPLRRRLREKRDAQTQTVLAKSTTLPKRLREILGR